MSKKDSGVAVSPNDVDQASEAGSGAKAPSRRAKKPPEDKSLTPQQKLAKLFREISNVPAETITPQQWDEAVSRGVDMGRSKRPKGEVSMLEWLVSHRIPKSKAQPIFDEHTQWVEDSRVIMAREAARRAKEEAKRQKAEAKRLAALARKKDRSGVESNRWHKERDFVLTGIKNNSIKLLNLSGYHMGGEASREVARCLKRNTSVVTVVLNNNDCGDEAAVEFGQTIQWNTTIQSLVLGGNGITTIGARALARGLAKNTTLTTLGLELNEDIDESERDRIAEMIEKNKEKRLKEGDQHADFQVSQAQGNLNSLRWADDQLGILNSLSRVSKLDLTGQSIGYDGAAAIAQKVKTYCSLKHLCLHTNEIGDRGANAIFRAISENEKCSLRHLDLQWNDIGNNGVRNALQGGGRRLEALHLGGNEISDEGVKCIVQKKIKLHTLNLGGNRIGDLGAWYIAEALEWTFDLHTLFLNTNLIGEAGGRAIAQALKMNEDSQLRHLDLHHNQVGELTGQAMAAIISTTNLKFVDLRYNKLSREQLLVVQRQNRIAREMKNEASTPDGRGGT